MDRAPFIRGVCARSKKRRGVEQAGFVVASDCNEGVGAFHLAEDRTAEVVGLSCARIRAKKCAANAQINDNTRSRAQIRLENRGRALRVERKPSLHFFALRRGG